MKPVFLIPVVALVLAGCDATNSNSRTQNGALVGAAIGGLIGATSTGDNKLERGVIGAAIGGAVGGVIGNELDKQAAELERDLDNEITVVNTGSELRVTAAIWLMTFGFWPPIWTTTRTPPSSWLATPTALATPPITKTCPSAARFPPPMAPWRGAPGTAGWRSSFGPTPFSVLSGGLHGYRRPPVSPLTNWPFRGMYFP